MNRSATYPITQEILPIDRFLILGELCKAAWKNHNKTALGLIAYYDLSTKNLAYHLKYEASPALIFQALIEEWSYDQIKYVVGAYRPDLVSLSKAA